MKTDEEIFPLVSETGETIGKATRSFCHSGAKPLHPVVHLHILNSRGELYLQLRAHTKDIQPGKWDTAVGGHVGYGELITTALKREAREELGIEEFDAIPLITYIFESEIEKELVYSFMTRIDSDLHPDPEELAGGRFWNLREITARIGENIFTPNFKQEFQRIKNLLFTRR